MGAFSRGQEAARRQEEHKTQQEDNKLRQQIYKNQIERLKIEDQLATRKLTRENFEMMQGQPRADLPQEDYQSPITPTATTVGDAGGLQGVIANLVQQRVGMGEGPTMPGAPLGTQTAQRPAMMQIPGVPALGVPGVNVRPQSLEDVIAGNIAAEMNKAVTLNPGDRRFVGGELVGEGAGRPVTVGRGGVAYPEGLGGPRIEGQPIPPPNPTEASLVRDSEHPGPTISGPAKRMLETLRKQRASASSGDAAAGRAATDERSRRTAKATAERWKSEQLQQVEKLYRDSQPIKDSVTGELMKRKDRDGFTEIEPMTLDELKSMTSAELEAVATRMGISLAEAKKNAEARGYVVK